MAGPRHTGLRHLVVAVLTFVLTLTGVGRGYAGTPSPDDPRYAVPGVLVQICHAGTLDGRGPAAPARPAKHDCCDACVLLAPAVLPEEPALAAPASLSDFAVPAQAQAWRPATARPRSPRQSQGPPEA